MPLPDNLITDRTAADVARAEYLSSLLWDNMTVAEREEFLTDLKGSYNASDLNRVGRAVAYLAERLTGYGYVVPVTAKQDWKDTDKPTATELWAYIADVRAIKEAMASQYPAPDSINGLDYEAANNIERIMEDTEYLLNVLSNGWWMSGEIYSGEGYFIA